MYSGIINYKQYIIIGICWVYLYDIKDSIFNISINLTDSYWRNIIKWNLATFQGCLVFFLVRWILKIRIFYSDRDYLQHVKDKMMQCFLYIRWRKFKLNLLFSLTRTKKVNRYLRRWHSRTKTLQFLAILSDQKILKDQ